MTMIRSSSGYSFHTVLLVDDVPALELYAEAFRQSYRVFATSTLDDAESILANEYLEIAVVEHSLGGEQGWDWMKRIIQLYAVPTIICSVLDDRRMGLDAGVRAYLIKPVPPAILSQAIADCLNKAR